MSNQNSILREAGLAGSAYNELRRGYIYYAYCGYEYLRHFDKLESRPLDEDIITDGIDELLESCPKYDFICIDDDVDNLLYMREYGCVCVTVKRCDNGLKISSFFNASRLCEMIDDVVDCYKGEMDFEKTDFYQLLRSELFMKENAIELFNMIKKNDGDGHEVIKNFIVGYSLDCLNVIDRMIDNRCVEYFNFSKKN